MQRKLDQNADFKIQCFFNFDHDLLFKQVFGNHPQVDIRTGDNVAANDVHYKIIDDGRKAYLSRHKLGLVNAGSDGSIAPEFGAISNM